MYFVSSNFLKFVFIFNPYLHFHHSTLHSLCLMNTDHHVADILYRTFLSECQAPSSFIHIFPRPALQMTQLIAYIGAA